MDHSGGEGDDQHRLFLSENDSIVAAASYMALVPTAECKTGFYLDQIISIFVLRQAENEKVDHTSKYMDCFESANKRQKVIARKLFYVSDILFLRH